MKAASGSGKAALIGLTGGYCAGKNAAAAFLEEEGFLALDVDKLGHQATEDSKEAILLRFGAAALGPDGRVDRRALADIAFNDGKALRDLEDIVHPAANALAEAWIDAHPDRALCLNAALLHRMPAIGRLSFILEIRAPLIVRLARARKRDGAGWRKALARIRAQRGFKARLRRSGRPVIVVRNGGALGAFRAALRKALERGQAFCP